MEILNNSSSQQQKSARIQSNQQQSAIDVNARVDIPNINLIDTEGIPLIEMIVSQDNRAFSELSLQAKTRQLFPVITDILTFDPISCLDPSFDERQLYASRQIKTVQKDQSTQKAKILNQKQQYLGKSKINKQSFLRQQQKRTTKIIRHDKNGNFRAFYYMLLLWIFNEKNCRDTLSQNEQQMIKEKSQIDKYAKQNDSFSKNSKISEIAILHSKQQAQRQYQISKQSEQNDLSRLKLKQLKESSRQISIDNQELITPQMKLKTLKMLIYSNSTDLSIIQNRPQLAFSLSDSSTFYNKNEKLQNNHLKKLLSQFLQHLIDKSNNCKNKVLPEKIIEQELNLFPIIDTLFICFLRSLLFYRFEVQEAKDFNKEVNDMTVFIALSETFDLKDIKNPSTGSFLILQKYHVSRISISMRIFFSQNSSGNTSRINKSQQKNSISIKNSRRQSKQNIQIEELNFAKSSGNAESSNKFGDKKQEVVYLLSLPDDRTKIQKEIQIKETEEIIEKINFQQTLSKVSSLGQFQKYNEEQQQKKNQDLQQPLGPQFSFLRNNEKRINLFNLFHESSQESSFASISTPIDSFVQFEDEKQQQKSIKQSEIKSIEKLSSKCKLQGSIFEFNNSRQLFEFNFSKQLHKEQSMKIIKQQDELASSSLFQTRMNTTRPMYMKTFLVNLGSKKVVITFTNLSAPENFQYQQTLSKNISFQNNILQNSPILQQQYSSEKSTDNFKMSPSQNTMPLKEMSPYSNYTDYKGSNNNIHYRENTQLSGSYQYKKDNLRSTAAKINPFSVNDFTTKTPSKDIIYHHKRADSGSNLTNKTSPSSYYILPSNSQTVANWKNIDNQINKKGGKGHEFRKINYGHKRNNGSSIVDYQRNFKLLNSSPQSQDSQLNYSHSFYRNPAHLKLSPHTYVNEANVTPQKCQTFKEDIQQNVIPCFGTPFQKKRNFPKQENSRVQNAKAYLFAKKVQTQHYFAQSSNQKQGNRSKSPYTTFTYTSPPKQSMNFEPNVQKSSNNQQYFARQGSNLRQRPIPEIKTQNKVSFNNPYCTTYRHASPSQNYLQSTPPPFHTQLYKKSQPTKNLDKSFKTKPIQMTQHDRISYQPIKHKKKLSLTQQPIIRNFSKNPQQNCFPKSYLTSLKQKQQQPGYKTNPYHIYKN